MYKCRYVDMYICIYVYVYICIHVYIYIYIYICIEREIERDIHTCTYVRFLCRSYMLLFSYTLILFRVFYVYDVNYSICYHIFELASAPRPVLHLSFCLLLLCFLLVSYLSKISLSCSLLYFFRLCSFLVLFCSFLALRPVLCPESSVASDVRLHASSFA